VNDEDLNKSEEVVEMVEVENDKSKLIERKKL